MQPIILLGLISTCLLISIIYHSSKHTMQTKRRHLKTNQANLKILTLGGSVTWGADLQKPQDAYPNLLDSMPQFTVTNMAIRASGSDYPSKCIESMIGEETYDVIVLEFTLNGTEGLNLLLKRLRNRFPHAILLYVDLYSLKHEAVHAETRLKPMYTEMNPSAHWIWSQDKIRHDDFHNYLVKQLNMVNGHVYQLPRRYPPMKALEFFAQDWHHLSPTGHKEVKDGIVNFLQSISLSPSDSPLGTWGKGDQCTTWFSSGQISLQHTSSQINEFAPFKYALQYRTEGTITIHNSKPFPIPLFVSFMTKHSIYPITEIQLKEDEVYAIDPSTKHQHHVTRTERIGWAEPGKNVLVVKPKGGAMIREPFRLTAVILCGLCDDDFVGGKEFGLP